MAPGGTVTLSNIQQHADIPPAVFVAGYNAGVLTTGVNNIPVTNIHTVIAGTNTVQGTQTTNNQSGTAATTITDPDGTPGTGDETATPGALDVTYANQTWTAGASGAINFREFTTPPPVTTTHRRHQHHCRGRRDHHGPVRLRPRYGGRVGASEHDRLHRSSRDVRQHPDPGGHAGTDGDGAATRPTVPAAGGNTVTIAGTDLTGATAVNFGANAATGFTVVNATDDHGHRPGGHRREHGRRHGDHAGGHQPDGRHRQRLHL